MPRRTLDRIPPDPRRNRAAAWGAGLAIVLTVALGNDSVPGTEKPDPAPPAKHDSVGAGLNEPPAGQLDLVVHHHIERGRLVVRLAGCAFLSLPFASAGGGAPARFERPLSVPSGRHPVEISFLDRQGKVVALKRTEGTVEAGQSVTLRVDEHSGVGDGLTLTWGTP